MRRDRADVVSPIESIPQCVADEKEVDGDDDKEDGEGGEGCGVGEEGEQREERGGEEVGGEGDEEVSDAEVEEEFEERDVETEVDGVGERETDAFLRIASGLEGPFEGGEVVADEADDVA